MFNFDNGGTPQLHSDLDSRAARLHTKSMQQRQFARTFANCGPNRRAATGENGPTRMKRQFLPTWINPIDVTDRPPPPAPLRDQSEATEATGNKHFHSDLNA